MAAVQFKKSKPILATVAKCPIRLLSPPTLTDLHSVNMTFPEIPRHPIKYYKLRYYNCNLNAL